jgi:hypothetical protein
MQLTKGVQARSALLLYQAFGLKGVKQGKTKKEMVSGFTSRETIFKIFMEVFELIGIFRS